MSQERLRIVAIINIKHEFSRKVLGYADNFKIFVLFNREQKNAFQ